MKKKIVLIITLTILSIFIISESKTLIKTLTDNNKVLEDVKISDILKNKDKTLSIMVQEDGDVTTFKEADNRDKWPDVSSYIFDKAECSDSEGNAVDYKSILTFDLDKKTTTVRTKQTVYCTLYFVKGKETLTLLQSKTGFTEKSGMYRFVGTSSTVKNNYICFGTTNQKDCLNNPDKYMYRIIGITKLGDSSIGLEAGQLKLIKAIPIKEDNGNLKNMTWNSDCNPDVPWDSSEMFAYLNGTEKSDQFLYTIKNGENGIYWDKLIATQNWYIQDQGLNSNPGETEEPTGKKTSKAGKIGLMYATDFANASTGTSSWLFITNGWTGNISIYEWTMTRYGNFYGYYAGYTAWTVLPEGNLAQSDVCYGNVAVRPVFYLKPGVLLLGDGSTTDPFRIAG